MIIAIDYDNTYTADPTTWDNVIKTFQAAGHTVICVTARSEAMGLPVLNSIGKLIPCLFCEGAWKREYALKHGYKVDVWIDDSPEHIARQHLIGTI
jgi:hydroxymethylpyrimidine pyrophosphatase-like HAD family hydrolase